MPPSKAQADKQTFLEENSGKYGYNGKIDQIREEEYPQLKDGVYLDHAGTTTYPQSTLQSFMTDLSENLYGNPHSGSPSSVLTAQKVDAVRNLILNHFDTTPGDYQVVFTQNATAAIKLVGETFPWKRDESWFKYLRENHTSVIGIRALAKEGGADISVVNEAELETILDEADGTGNIDLKVQNDDRIAYNLFAYPAQCNFSGMKFPLSWTRRLKESLNTEESRVLVLLDAAAYVTSSQLSLKDTKSSPDFVNLSFYKLFGYPTGLGALLVKTELTPILKKRYFGGGTTTGLLYDADYAQFRPTLSETLEDGTINFLNIMSLYHAFTTFKKLYISMNHVNMHTAALISYLYDQLSAMKHYNGAPVCEIFSSRDFHKPKMQGPILNFNFKKPDGSWVGYAEVEKLVSASNIHLRVGTFCNPGSAARWFNLTQQETMMAIKAGKACGDELDILNTKPTGSVRISVGAMTTIDDVITFVIFVKDHYVEMVPPAENLKSARLSGNAARKSWKGLSANPQWQVVQKMSLYDQEWVLLDARSGSTLNQRRKSAFLLIPQRQFETLKTQIETGKDQGAEASKSAKAIPKTTDLEKPFEQFTKGLASRKNSVKLARETPVEKTDPASAPAPVSNPFSTPVSNPFSTPASSPFSVPVSSPFSVPVSNPFSAPASDSSSAPAPDSSSVPAPDPLSHEPLTFSEALLALVASIFRVIWSIISCMIPESWYTDNSLLIGLACSLVFFYFVI